MACSSFKILKSTEKEAFFRYFMKHLLEKGLLEQVIERGTTCLLEEKYLRLAQKYMKEKYHILIQWKKLSALQKQKDFNFEQTFYLLSRWIKRQNHSCIVRVDSPRTGDHWTVFKRVKFPVGNLIDSYHFLKINLIKLAWKPRRAKKSSKETQIMKEGIFFINAKPLTTTLRHK